MAKYLSSTGLTTLWNKIQKLFYPVPKRYCMTIVNDNIVPGDSAMSDDSWKEVEYGRELYGLNYTIVGSTIHINYTDSNNKVHYYIGTIVVSSWNFPNIVIMAYERIDSSPEKVTGDLYRIVMGFDNTGRQLNYLKIQPMVEVYPESKLGNIDLAEGTTYYFVEQ